MKIIKTPIKDLLIIEPKVFEDERGYFFESYNKSSFEKLGLKYNFVQDNESYSKFGVFRGFHFQKPPMAQSKLVRVVKGKVIDIAIDLRYNSPTYKKFYWIELSEENKLQFLIPRGFAHGFLVLSEYAIFQYKVDNFYSPEHNGGINIFDPDINFPIEKFIDKNKLIISNKDKNLPFLRDIRPIF